MKITFFSLMATIAFLWTIESQALVAQTHDVNVTHPLHGPTTLTVHEDDVHTRHPEAIPPKAVSGKSLGCDANDESPYCATKNQPVPLSNP
jgi:hypothetical protein